MPYGEETVYPTIIFPSGMISRRPRGFWVATASMKETGPTRPRYIVKISISLLGIVAMPVGPTDNPVVEKAEVASYTASSMDMPIASTGEVERSTPVVTHTRKTPHTRIVKDL